MDPNLSSKLDPDLHEIDADPKHWRKEQLL
jgi:hypothetical protein